jgi:hypothetical protein
MDTSRMEKENRSGCPADQEDQDNLRMSQIASGWCEQDATVYG